MNNLKRRGLALVLVMASLISCFCIFSFNTGAADFSYTYDGKYIYNWGERGETATFLSPNAEKFYASHSSYEELSSYSGGINVSDAPKSSLYYELQRLMKNAQTYTTSYEATKSLYKYTDCQNGGGKISSFYSGKLIGPSWDGAWNREHTWPNSKGLGGSDENDIMMLRPTSTSENSSRGNTAYGESSGYYHPNSESGGKYDLRGDVARIFLYVYVRWGNVNGNGSYTAWGKTGVMESVEVLLDWMEADPVDTWELGRNDSVESITGTRNVFVDYPELAFLLFGEEIPDDIVTPSGRGNQKCGHDNFDAGVTVSATCTSGGYTLYTCRTAGCGYSYRSNATDATGHSYVGGKCTACGEAEPEIPPAPTYVTEIKTGVPYKLGFLQEGKGTEYYFTGEMSGYYGATATDFDQGVDVYVETVSGGYHLYFKNSGGQKQYINLVLSGTHYNFTYSATSTSVFTWDQTKHAFYTTVSGEICYMGTYGSYYTVSVLRSSKYQDSDYIARMYVFDEGGSDEQPDETCKHSYTAAVTAPTCTKGGHTTYTCSLCGHSYKGNETSAIGHSYVGGKCSTCGAVKNTEGKATISFADTANRTVFSNTQQIWVQNGITVTNNKSKSNIDVANYSNPARFYASSDVIIEYPGITKLEINCTGLGDKYVSGWLEVTGGATATNNGGVITVTFASPVDSVTYTNLSAQSRAYDITVYFESAEPEPEHKYNEYGYCEHCQVKIGGASVTLGQDLTMNYSVSIADKELLASLDRISMRFTMNGKTVTVALDPSKKTAEGDYVFSFEGIAPQCMADNISAELMLGESVIADVDEYSVKKNAETLLEIYPTNRELKQLVVDMLTYGATAQIYKDHNVNSLASKDLPGGCEPSEALPTESPMTMTQSASESVKFKSAHVWFDNVNKIGVVLSTDKNVRLKVNGVEAKLSGTTYYTEAIYATGFDKVYTFELYEGNTLVQTLTYSVADYVYAMMNKTDAEGELTEMAELARALYRYGVSAAAYRSTQP